MISILTDATRRRIDVLLTGQPPKTAARLICQNGTWDFEIKPAMPDDVVLSWGTGRLAVTPELFHSVDMLTLSPDGSSVLAYQIYFSNQNTSVRG